MTISLDTFERVSLEDDDAKWELVCGHLRRKPGMTANHSWAIRTLTGMLASQIDHSVFAIDAGSARLYVSTGSYYMPDLCVVPKALRPVGDARLDPHIEILRAPLPLVAEVWSPSTGGYDVETKLREYQLRGDAEIWRLHPYERTLTSRERRPDGSYAMIVYDDGSIVPVALPAVTIDIPTLFE